VTVRILSYPPFASDTETKAAGFTQGPPTKDTILQSTTLCSSVQLNYTDSPVVVKKIVAYYSLQGESGLPSGCTQAQVCVV
jgi:hypothetical protein